jgi:hypothetical protein
MDGDASSSQVEQINAYHRCNLDARYRRTAFQWASDLKVAAELTCSLFHSMAALNLSLPWATRSSSPRTRRRGNPLLERNPIRFELACVGEEACAFTWVEERNGRACLREGERGQTAPLDLLRSTSSAWVSKSTATWMSLPEIWRAPAAAWSFASRRKAAAFSRRCAALSTSSMR